MLRDVDLHITRGQFVYLTGSSGAGKTTLLRLLFGADLPTRGEVRVGGVLVTALKPAKIALLRRQIGVIFQDFKLIHGLNVFENVALSLRAAGKKGTKLINRVNWILDLVGLRGMGEIRADTLSGGEQQRVAVARALVSRPALILADEPTGNLDPDNARIVLGLLADAHRAGSTVIVATHDPAILTMVKRPRVVQLAHGRVGERT